VTSCLGEFIVHYLFKGSVLSFNKELKPVLVALGVLEGEHTVPFLKMHSTSFPLSVIILKWHFLS